MDNCILNIDSWISFEIDEWIVLLDLYLAHIIRFAFEFAALLINWISSSCFWSPKMSYKEIKLNVKNEKTTSDLDKEGQMKMTDRFVIDWQKLATLRFLTNLESPSIKFQTVARKPHSVL